MQSSPAPAAHLVIYAKNITRVAAFYAQTLTLPVLEEDASFILLGSPALEIAVVQMPAALAQQVQLSSPPAVRTGTPLKFSWTVDDFEHVRLQAQATGGALQAPETAWLWRGQWHLDGHDPEGNVVQFRRRDR